MDDAAPEIEVDDEGALRVITLNRPHRLNAFTAEGYRLLAAALRDADDATQVSVVLLQGAGRAFSSGVDLGALLDSDNSTLARVFGELIDTLVGLRKPLLAAVHGVAVGFGATLLLHCDLVVVADDARLRFPFTQLGTAPEAGSSWLLPQAIGAQRASDLILTSRWVDGPEAVALGLAARCVPASGLAAAVRDAAAAIAANPQAAVIAAKRLLKTATAGAVAEATAKESAVARLLTDELGALRPR